MQQHCFTSSGGHGRCGGGGGRLGSGDGDNDGGAGSGASRGVRGGKLAALAASAAAVAEMLAGLRVWCEGLQVVDQNSATPPTPPALTSQLVVACIVANTYTYPANRACTWAILLQAFVEKALSQKLHGTLVPCRGPSDAAISTVNVVDVVLPNSVSEGELESIATPHPLMLARPSSESCVTLEFESPKPFENA